MQKIHIALVSRETLPIYYLIKEFKPDLTYFITTSKYWEKAECLMNVLAKEGTRCLIANEVDAYDINSTIDVCEQLHQSFDHGSEVSYNITGGTKMMAIGVYTTAQAHNADIFYTDSDYYVDVNNYSKYPLEVKVDSQTIFDVQGQKLKTYAAYRYNAILVESADYIREFISHFPMQYKKLRREYDSRKLQRLPLDYLEYKDLFCQYDKHDGQLIVQNNLVRMLDIAVKDSLALLFEGRWWEVLTAQAVYQWAGGLYEIWCNVKFSPSKMTKKSDLDKNEVDILVNTGNKLLFIECKSGDVTQDNITKMSYVRQNYGSAKSKSVLVTFWHIRPDIREKAKEENIFVIESQRLDELSGELNHIIESF